jgi:hypothetical protein
MSSQEGLSPWSDGIQQVLNYVDSSYFPGHLLGPKQEGMDVMANELTLCTDPRAYSCQSDSLSAGQLRLHAKKWLTFVLYLRNLRVTMTVSNIYLRIR